MRIIAGAELDEHDIKAIEKGEPLSAVLARRMLLDPLEGADIVAKRRLETLAYLAREGRLEIRIGVPLDKEGRPLPAIPGQGVLPLEVRDPRGPRGQSARLHRVRQRVRFRLARQLRGLHGREVVAARGLEGDGSAARRPVRGALERAARRGVAVVDLPVAVRDHLIKFAPPEAAAAVDPEEGIEPHLGRRRRIRSCSSSRLPRGSTEAPRSASRPPA